jgi:hypothetical protein
MLAAHRQSVITEFRHSVCKNRRRQHTASVLGADTAHTTGCSLPGIAHALVSWRYPACDTHRRERCL